MNRPNFQQAPDLWLRASRTYQSAAERATAFHAPERKERFAGVLVALTIGLALASVLVIGWSGGFH